MVVIFLFLEAQIYFDLVRHKINFHLQKEKQPELLPVAFCASLNNPLFPIRNSKIRN